MLHIVQLPLFTLALSFSFFPPNLYSYILSLALADLLVILVCVPVATIVYTQESWPFERNMCRITEFFKDISIGVSVFTLTALSGERYCAIVNPLRKLQVSAKKRAAVLKQLDNSLLFLSLLLTRQNL